jgi:hypothetical protein
MRKIIQSAVAAALIATSAAPAVAAAPQHHGRNASQASAIAQLRNARNAMEQTSGPGLPYSGWSAPAGR